MIEEKRSSVQVREVNLPPIDLVHCNDACLNSSNMPLEQPGAQVPTLEQQEEAVSHYRAASRCK